MSRAGTLPTLLAAGSFAAPPAEAPAEITPLSALELYSSCLAYRQDPDGAGGRACAAYLLGFLDGSNGVRRGDAPRADGGSFRERALRTRAGSRHSSLMRHCLDASVSLEQLIGELLARRVADAERTPASTAVDRSLRSFGGCRPH
jgi:hypothetical protein